MKKAIIIIGQPGAGKGTQAELISKKFNVFHFDTGKFLENIFYFSGTINDPEIKKEKGLFDSGKLNTPEFVAKKVEEHVKKIASNDMGVVFSGSPRTEFEAFGDKGNNGFMKELENLYEKKNIIIFSLEISEEDSIHRNSNRLICSVCGSPILSFVVEKFGDIERCPFCGGKLRKRVLDNPETIKVRLIEYKERTQPVLDGFAKRGYKIHKIDGKFAPYKVFKNISKIINDIH